MSRKAAKAQVYQITGARRSLSDDVHAREVRYLISMGIRTVCVVLALVVPYWPLRAVFVAGAVFLPYFSVVFANAGREPVHTSPLSTALTDQRLSLPPQRDDPDQPDQPDDPEQR